MKEFFKKLSIPAYLLPVSAVVSLVAMIILFASNADPNYVMVGSTLVVVLSVLSIILFAAAFFLSGKIGDGRITAIVLLAAVIVTALCVYFTFGGKTDVFGSVIFSSLEKGYPPAERACWLGIASIVMYVVATLIGAVAGFFTLSKKSK